MSDPTEKAARILAEHQRDHDDLADLAGERRNGHQAGDKRGDDHRDPDGDGARNLPRSFWDARPSLTAIRQAAHSRATPADAVLAVVLARAVAPVPPEVTLPPIIGGRGSLNACVGTVGPSGAGKSAAADVAGELVPITTPDCLDGLPVGSGEGLVEAFMGVVTETDDQGKEHQVKQQVRSGVFSFLDEGAALADMGKRSGATLIPTMRSAWIGALLGQGNASTERKRRLAPHSYRLCIVVGFQAANAATIIEDAEAGTPQRWLWASATDPSVPDKAPAWPDWSAPSLGPIIGERSMGVPGEVTTEIRAQHLARIRGEDDEIDPLDSHRMLSRLKVAAALAILEGRLDLELEDWALAGVMMETSDAVRSGVIAAAQWQAREREQAANRKAVRLDAHRAESAKERSTGNMARALARHVWRNAHRADHECRRRCVSRATASSDRDHATVDDAIAAAVEAGWITAEADAFDRGEAQP